jgi:hypothetical protein
MHVQLLTNSITHILIYLYNFNWIYVVSCSYCSFFTALSLPEVVFTLSGSSTVTYQW